MPAVLSDAQAEAWKVFRNLKVKKQNGTTGVEYLGLLVKPQYAERFVQFPEDARKVMEIRPRKVSFIDAGDKLALVSTLAVSHAGPASTRTVLAILEFEGQIRIAVDKFDKFFGLHRVSQRSLPATGQRGPTHSKTIAMGTSFRSCMSLKYGRWSICGLAKLGFTFQKSS